ncbi:hypothetical protein, partial [Nocardia neocaledoniensis]|uniref:hypothetical protein n=1 Tax=Nocardia neocaledoniensis TaxID=236511 RepID=UPI0024556132
MLEELAGHRRHILDAVHSFGRVERAPDILADLSQVYRHPSEFAAHPVDGYSDFAESGCEFRRESIDHFGAHRVEGVEHRAHALAHHSVQRLVGVAEFLVEFGRAVGQTFHADFQCEQGWA